MANGKSNKDEMVIYYSEEDQSWIAHSLRTDQMGFGDCVVDALVDLMTGLYNLYELAKKENIQILDEAPQEIKNLTIRAKRLEPCIFQIAFEKYLNKFTYPVHIDIPHSERFTAECQESFA